ncbi:hypothetical protein CCR75_002527 [Bremia lactucae]|uniref:Deacetylase sirtuin-type domain-containing protein n=1 Tax=Bremia lactucae TaxID=4779 RepID=A0A976IHR6_BRELC|nr:hypothetical protein CCR75_002527 [Bremia lactucae]
MMTLSDRPRRKAKRTDVDYAVLSSGQQIPEYSDENDDSNDESYGSNYRKKRRKQKTECFICHRPPRTYKRTMLQCDSCSRLYHAACGKPFQSASILGNTSCYECLQEAKVDSLSALPREPLNSIADFVKILKKAKKILIIAGAGISVSCGIPDFRSKDGIYAMARKMDVVLPEPECLFQIDYFRDDPAPFFEVVRHAFATSPKPSLTHWFFKLLQNKNKLLRVYTQNIDGLEQAAGVTRCIPCHGSFAYSACMRCKKRMLTSSLMPVIQAGIVPSCSEAHCRGVFKPEITFFGEMLPDKVSTMITKDRVRADLLLVMGTSLKVAPVMEIPSYLPSHIPQVVINKTALTKKKLKAKVRVTNGMVNSRSGFLNDKLETRDEEDFDMSLLGNCDDILRYVCAQAGWELEPPAHQVEMTEAATLENQVVLHENTCRKRVYCFGTCQCKNKLATNMDKKDEGQDEEQEKEELHDIACNYCRQRIDTEAEPIIGSKTVHYHCNDCFDYDLCGECYLMRKDKHKGGRHRFSQCL